MRKWMGPAALGMLMVAGCQNGGPGGAGEQAQTRKEIAQLRDEVRQLREDLASGRLGQGIGGAGDPQDAQRAELAQKLQSLSGEMAELMEQAREKGVIVSSEGAANGSAERIRELRAELEKLDQALAAHSPETTKKPERASKPRAARRAPPSTRAQGNGKTVTGTVEFINDDWLCLQNSKGEIVSFKLGPDSYLSRQGERSSIQQLKEGAVVRASGNPGEDYPVAQQVEVLQPRKDR